MRAGDDVDLVVGVGRLHCELRQRSREQAPELHRARVGLPRARGRKPAVSGAASSELRHLAGLVWMVVLRGSLDHAKPAPKANWDWHR